MGREPLLKRPCGLQPIKDASNRSHSVLIPVSRSYSQLEGRLLTRSSPLRHCALLHRSTCMPNPCRQRSFWARIKLSVQKSLFCNRLEFVCAFLLLQKKFCWIHLRFKFSWSNIDGVCFSVQSRSGPFALFNFSRNTGFSSVYFKLTRTLNRAEQRVLNLAHFSVLSSAIQILFWIFLFAGFCSSQQEVTRFLIYINLQFCQARLLKILTNFQSNFLKDHRRFCGAWSLI